MRHKQPDRQMVVGFKPRNKAQAQFMKLMQSNDVIFGIGAAGTGKTYCAIAEALDGLFKGTYEKIILVRPAIATEDLGFLPGDQEEKLDPYLRPMYDAINSHFEGKPNAHRELIGDGRIEIAPLAFMRGRTLNKSFVLLDEAQNTTTEQMKMFLTRLGEGSKFVVTGDPTQHDLPRHTASGLSFAVERFAQLPGVGVMWFMQSDVVRHSLVKLFIEGFANAQAQKDE